MLEPVSCGSALLAELTVPSRGRAAGCPLTLLGTPVRHCDPPGWIAYEGQEYPLPRRSLERAGKSPPRSQRLLHVTQCHAFPRLAQAWALGVLDPKTQEQNKTMLPWPLSRKEPAWSPDGQPKTRRRARAGPTRSTRVRGSTKPPLPHPQLRTACVHGAEIKNKAFLQMTSFFPVKYFYSKNSCYINPS